METIIKEDDDATNKLQCQEYFDDIISSLQEDEKENKNPVDEYIQKLKLPAETQPLLADKKLLSDVFRDIDLFVSRYLDRIIRYIIRDTKKIRQQKKRIMEKIVEVLNYFYNRVDGLSAHSRKSVVVTTIYSVLYSVTVTNNFCVEFIGEIYDFMTRKYKDFDIEIFFQNFNRFLSMLMLTICTKKGIFQDSNVISNRSGKEGSRNGVIEAKDGTRYFVKLSEFQKQNCSVDNLTAAGPITPKKRHINIYYADINHVMEIDALIMISTKYDGDNFEHRKRLQMPIDYFVSRRDTVIVYELLPFNHIDVFRRIGGEITGRVGTTLLRHQLYARRWTKELVEAVLMMHEASVSHRDIKPQNVMFDADNRLILIDFDLASTSGVDVVNESKHFDLTYTLPMTTLCYRAPELLLNTDGYDRFLIDVFSIGITLIDLLNGGTYVLHNWFSEPTEEKGIIGDVCDLLGHSDDVLTFFRIDKRTKSADEGFNYKRIRDVFGTDGIALLKLMTEVDPRRRLTLKQLVDSDVYKRYTADV